MSKKSKQTYRVACPVCGAGPHECCRVVPTGQRRARAHNERAALGAKGDAVPLVRQVACPSCGAQPGERCKRTTQPALRAWGWGWEYCTPVETKRPYCAGRWMVSKGWIPPDVTEDSATETGLWVPEEFHESAADNGLLIEVMD